MFTVPARFRALAQAFAVTPAGVDMVEEEDVRPLTSGFAASGTLKAPRTASARSRRFLPLGGGVGLTR